MTFVTASNVDHADNAEMATAAAYLLAGEPREIERLRTIARAFEPAGQALLDRLGPGEGLRALDVGCGPMGWLRPLSRWVGPRGSVVGTDIQPGILEAAGSFVAAGTLSNVVLLLDDLFDSGLPPSSFDLVHARFELAPLGRAAEQMAAYLRLCKPGAWLVLEEPASASWQFHPSAPAAERLIHLIIKAFADGGGDFDAGRSLPDIFRRHVGVEPAILGEVLALPPGDPFLRQPLAFAAALRLRLTELMAGSQLDRLVSAAGDELRQPLRWGTSFTLIQAYSRVPA